MNNTAQMSQLERLILNKSIDSMNENALMMNGETPMMSIENNMNQDD